MAMTDDERDATRRVIDLLMAENSRLLTELGERGAEGIALANERIRLNTELRVSDLPAVQRDWVKAELKGLASAGRKLEVERDRLAKEIDGRHYAIRALWQMLKEGQAE